MSAVSGSAALAGAWAAYHKTIDALREELCGYAVSQQSNVAAISNYLAQMQAFAYHQVIAPRQRMPVILGPSTFSVHGFRMGMQSPNFLYRAIYIDGADEYRLFGTRGRTLFNQILVMRGGYSDDAPAQIGEYDLDAFVDSDGRFDIRVGGLGEGPRIALEPSSRNNWIFMRECFQDWDSGEQGDDMDIEPVGDFTSLPTGKLDDEETIHRLAGAQRLIRVLHATAGWPHFKVHNFDKTGPHRFSPLVHPKAAAYNPVAHYLYAFFDLADDEALVVEADASQGFRFWDICVCDVWGQDADFIYHQSSLTNAQAAADADGRVRIVLSAKDPGVPNWLDTVGLKAGTLMWRWYWTKSEVQPSCRVVKRAAVRDALPAATPHVERVDREAELRRRRRSFTRRYRHLL